MVVEMVRGIIKVVEDVLQRSNQRMGKVGSNQDGRCGDETGIVWV